MSSIFDHLKGLTGGNTTPASRISSAITSLILFIAMVYLLLDYKIGYEKWIVGIVFFIGVHITNQLIFTITENRKYACPKCGNDIKVIGKTFEKHKCKK